MINQFLCALNLERGSGPRAIVVRLGDNASRSICRLETNSRLIVRIHTCIEHVSSRSGYVILSIQAACHTLRQ
jgi:hypothetical protein